MKIKALNESESSNSLSYESSNDVGKQDAPKKETSEEEYFCSYRQALRLIQEGKDDEAKITLEDLEEDLNDQCYNDNEPIQRLKFSVLRNLGNLDKDDVSYYVKALEIDPTDISLWIRTGERCLSLGDHSFAKRCYEQALEMNPTNWISIDRLIEIYYIMHMPFELHDICLKALSLNKNYNKALLMLDEASNMNPSLSDPAKPQQTSKSHSALLIASLDQAKRKRRLKVQDDLQKYKKTKLFITLDTVRTQSLTSFGGYIIRVYERFAKQCITKNTMIDITINNSSTLSQQFNNGSISSQMNTQTNSDPQTTNSQDAVVAMEAEGASNSEHDKSDNKNEFTTSNDDAEPPKVTNRARSQALLKNSSLSFAAMLFPMDMNDKRRSSRNRSNQDDTFSFKMKFDELNDLLPECLRIGAIEQALQKRREESQKIADEDMDIDHESSSILIESNLEPVREDLIIKDIIEAISAQASTSGSATSNIRLCDMFKIYLSKLSAKKQNNLPETFAKIYRIYRRFCPISNEIFIEIGPTGVEIDELWFTLTANEINYQFRECMFLLRFLEQLQIHLDDSQQREFLVRLFLVLGLNYDARYLEAALQNIEEDVRIYASNRKIITRAHIKTLIDKNAEKLQQEIAADSDDSLDLINKLGPKSENEMSDREIFLLCRAIKSAGIWQRGLNILNQRNDLNSDIIIETMNACLKNGAKMDAILASKLCKDALSGSRAMTWSCLYRGWVSVLTEQEVLSEKTISDMTKFFDLGHQILGKKGTCSLDNGEFLMLYVQHLLDEERDCFDERGLLASMYCLFGYPNKRPASVVGHKATKVPMLWDYGQTIFHYLAPEELPTYMSLLRKVGITSEVVGLLREIAAAIPSNLDPQQEVHVIEHFIQDGQPLETCTVQADEVTKDLFYLIADYHFKNKDFNTAKLFYHYDLVINSDRFDSWAASGLIRASGVDKALSDGLITTADFVEGPFFELANSAIRCFERATQLNPNESKATLWIEFGNLTYNLTSLASRLFIYDDFEMEIDGKEPCHTAKLIDRHKYLYKLAKDCFSSANRLCACDEVWLHYYMLGKIHEKADTLKSLEFYYKADGQLFSEGASYPKKISYHNPPDLAYESMEIHYRTHAAVLKYLLTSTDLTQEHLNKVRTFLLDAQRSPFVVLEGEQDPKDAMSKRVKEDVDLLLKDMIDSVLTDASFDGLIFMCLHGMKRCLARCDKNFKALYRLAFYYRKIQDSGMAQDIMLSRELRTDSRVSTLSELRSEIPEFARAPPDLRGVDSLFKDRKMGNLFFNIWRMPIEEIDRPGCFEHWMFKCTWLLIKTCLDSNDTNNLSMIAFQLSRQPETSKKYLQDRPRVLLALFAVRSVISVLAESIETAEDRDTRVARLKEAYVVADRFIKSNVFADKMREFLNHLQGKYTAV